MENNQIQEPTPDLAAAEAAKVAAEQLRLNRQFFFDFAFAAGRMALGVADQMKMREEVYFDMSSDHIPTRLAPDDLVDTTIVQFQVRPQRIKDNRNNDVNINYTPEQFKEYAVAVAKRRFGYIDDVNKKAVNLIFMPDVTAPDSAIQLVFGFPDEASFRGGITYMAQGAVTFLLTGEMPPGAVEA